MKALPMLNVNDGSWLGMKMFSVLEVIDTCYPLYQELPGMRFVKLYQNLRRGVLAFPIRNFREPGAHGLGHVRKPWKTEEQWHEHCIMGFGQTAAFPLNERKILSNTGKAGYSNISGDVTRDDGRVLWAFDAVEGWMLLTCLTKIRSIIHWRSLLAHSWHEQRRTTYKSTYDLRYSSSFYPLLSIWI